MKHEGQSGSNGKKRRTRQPFNLSEMTSFTGYTTEPLPSEELKTRERIFFSTSKQQHTPPTEKELRSMTYKVTEEWFKGILDSVKKTFVTKRMEDGTVRETVEIKEILPVSFVREVLTLGTRMLASCPNVLDLTVPPTSIKGLKKKLPEEYTKAITKKYKNIPDVHVASLNTLTDLEPIDVGVTSTMLPCYRLVVVGDTHGTFEAIGKIIMTEGFPTEDEIVYLFNGDYVDRGSFSIEIFIVLLAIKLARPNAIHLLRGNHETESVNSNYSLPVEIEKKYGKTLSEEERDSLLSAMNKAFQTLPLCAIINDRYFVVHGGISAWPDFNIRDLERLNRFREPEQADFTDYAYFDPLSDVLWADPGTENPEFMFNCIRGTSVIFGETAAQRFLRKSNLKCIIRSHSCVEEGWQEEYPNVYTLFSVPNYAEKNLGAYAVFYGLYNKSEELSQVDKELLKDDPTPKGKYKVSPTNPLVFIKKFTCSENSAMINQPLLGDGSASSFLDGCEDGSADICAAIRNNEHMKLNILYQVLEMPEHFIVTAPEEGGLVIPHLIGSTVGTKMHSDRDSNARLKKKIISSAKQIPVPDSIPTDDLLDALNFLADCMYLTTSAVLGALPPELHTKLIHVPMESVSYSLEDLDINIPENAFPPTLPVEVIDILLSALLDPKKRDSRWLEEEGAKKAMRIFRAFHDFREETPKRDKFLVRLFDAAGGNSYVPPFCRPYRYSKIKY